MSLARSMPDGAPKQDPEGESRFFSVHFWSGTGNSLKVALWAQALAQGKGWTCTPPRPVERKQSRQEIPTGPGHIWALALPTHGFTAPWPVLRFLLALPRGKGTPAVVLVTRGGSWPGFPLPGFAGSAPWLCALVLLLKGYRVQGLLGVDMPQNWTALFPGLSPDHASWFHSRAQKRTRSFMAQVLDRKRQIFSLPKVLEGLGGLLLMPVSLLYLLLGHFYLAKLFFTTESCTGCGLCARHCPQQAIHMKGKKGQLRPHWTFRCASCGRCINYCPPKAIQAGHNILAILLWVTTLPLFPWLFKGLSTVGIKSSPPTGLAGFLLELPVRLFAIWLVALLLTPLLRLPLVNRLFALTTPTRWFRRYRMPGITLQQMTHKDPPSRTGDNTI